MFEWKVEELKLWNKYRFSKVSFFDECSSVSYEDEIAFIDRIIDGKMTRFINGYKKFIHDISCGEIKTERDGRPKTTSLVAWTKRNGLSDIIDTKYTYGRLIGKHFCQENIYSLYKDINNLYSFIEKVFNSVLHDCFEKEKQYFLSHDDYEIEKKKLQDNLDRYRTTFGINIATGSGGVQLYRKSELSPRYEYRQFTMEELKLINSKYDILSETIKKESDGFNIDF